MAYDIICSGTGPSFFSMLGVCRALHELRVPVQNVACTSGSSIPFALVYGAKMDWFDAYNSMIDLKFRKHIAFRPWRGGIYDTTGVERWIDEQTGGMTLKETKLDCFSVNSVDIKNKRMHIITNKTEPDITFGKAVRMTIGIPGVFAPVSYKNKWFVDGGVYRNVQLDAFQDTPNKKLIFIEVDKDQEVVGEVWKAETCLKRPRLTEIAMNSIACLMKSRFEIASANLLSNSTIIPIKIKDTSDLSPDKATKERLFRSGFIQTTIAVSKILKQEVGE